MSHVIVLFLEAPNSCLTLQLSDGQDPSPTTLLRCGELAYPDELFAAHKSLSDPTTQLKVFVITGQRDHVLPVYNGMQ